MPKVGKEKFDYTKKGEAEAKAYAKETGQEVEYPTYDAGGRVEVYRDGGKVEKKQVGSKMMTANEVMKESIKKKKQGILTPPMHTGKNPKAIGHKLNQKKK